jgi:aminoglycoside 6'-N-acetyltransferase
VRITADELIIRRMRDDPADYEAMARWLTDPRVLEFFEGRDEPHPLERVRAKYGPSVLGHDEVTPCLIIENGRAIGYLQFYRLDDLPAHDRDAYLLGAETDGVWAIDLFIGEPELWGKGIGTCALKATVGYLFDERSARRVVIDPQVTNARAIRCYEKVGFQKVKVLEAHELHEGERRDNWLMVLDRPPAP